MIAWLLLAGIWCGCSVFAGCVYALVRMWLERRATWAPVVEHHEAMRSLRKAVRHG